MIIEHMKFKVKGKYEWGEARLEAVERLAGTVRSSRRRRRRRRSIISSSTFSVSV